MPESKRDATARAKRVGIPASNVVKTDKGHFIAPRGVTPQGKRVYGALRAEGMPATKAAKIAHKKG